jgi:FkbM family methyltransferase
MAAYVRWMRWQIGSRVLGEPVLMPYVESSCLVVERSMTGATGNIYCGLHEFEDMAFVLHCLRVGDTFVDIGANIGSYTVLASGVVGCETISLEPVPSTYQKLVRNVRVNGIEGLVELHHCAAGAGVGEVWFRTDHDTMNRVVDEGEAVQKERVRVCGMDQLLRDRVGEIWKVDVEGYEWEVLRGSGEALRHDSLRAVMLEGDDERIASCMRGAGFTAMTYDPWERRLSEVVGEKSRRVTGNHLWVKDCQWVRDRCAQSRRYEVCGVTF